MLVVPAEVHQVQVNTKLMYLYMMIAFWDYMYRHMFWFKFVNTKGDNSVSGECILCWNSCLIELQIVWLLCCVNVHVRAHAWPCADPKSDSQWPFNLWHRRVLTHTINVHQESMTQVRHLGNVAICHDWLICVGTCRMFIKSEVLCYTFTWNACEQIL